MHYDGHGVRQDYEEAAKWFRLAAEQGNAEAQFTLARQYAHGEGVPQDYKEAVKWYRLAAEQGDADAQVNLGILYVIGHGVPQDYVQAHTWFNLAAATGDADGAKARDKVAREMTPEQIADAQRRAREWKPTTSR
jgi:TPR repeat protein